ncbi:MAG: hypothetical protein ABII90_00645 [Bacteroidota bacterium]
MDINKIEKVELHCHSEGIICPGKLSVLQKQYNKYQEIDLVKLNRFFPVKNYKKWIEFIESFRPVYKKHVNILYDLTELYIKELIRYNVKYCEIMLYFAIYSDQNIDFSLINKFNDLKQKYKNIKINFLGTLLRTLDLKNIYNNSIHSAFSKKRG